MKEIIINNINTGYFASEDGYIVNSKGNILKQYNTNGYLTVYISKFGTKLVHILIWTAYNGIVPEGYEINHKDGIKTNPRLDNLEVVTHSENCKHSFRIGLQTNTGSNHPGCTINEVIARDIKRMLFIDGKTCTSIAKHYNISINVVKEIKRNRTWKNVDINAEFINTKPSSIPFMKPTITTSIKRTNIGNIKFAISSK